MVVMRRYGKSRRTLEGQEVKSFLSLVCWRAAGVGIGLAIITRNGTFYYTRNIVQYTGYCINTADVSCTYHGCCIQTVCMDGTFQRKM